GKDAAGREAGDRARQLPRREDPPRLLEDRQEKPRHLGEAQARDGAAERRQGQPRRQPREEALVRKLLALASVLLLSGSIGIPAPFAGSGGSYFPGARVHTALLRDSILNPEHGAVEVWYRQASDPVPYKH